MEERSGPPRHHVGRTGRGSVCRRLYLSVDKLLRLSRRVSRRGRAGGPPRLQGAAARLGLHHRNADDHRGHWCRPDWRSRGSRDRRLSSSPSANFSKALRQGGRAPGSRRLPTIAPKTAQLETAKRRGGDADRADRGRRGRGGAAWRSRSGRRHHPFRRVFARRVGADRRVHAEEASARAMSSSPVRSIRKPCCG